MSAFWICVPHLAASWDGGGGGGAGRVLRGWGGLSRVYTGRAGRQWLHSNLCSGSVTVLFLAPRPRVSVSPRGSYQLPGLTIGPPTHPAFFFSSFLFFLPPFLPAAVFQFPRSADVTLASCKGAGPWFETAVIDRTDRHSHPHTSSVSAFPAVGSASHFCVQV